MFRTSFILLVCYIVLSTPAASEVDLHVKISQLESQVAALTQRVLKDEETIRQCLMSQKKDTGLSLQRQVDLLEWKLQNITALEVKNSEIEDVIEKVQRWSKNEMLVPSKRYASSSDPNEVAFTAVLTVDLNDLPVHSPIVFDHLAYKTGTTFDVSTGVFTCPTSGLYLFSVFIESGSVNTEACVSLKMEGTIYMKVVSERMEVNEDDTGGNVCLMNVHKGQRVWVETYQNDKQSFWSTFTTFSGVLIHSH